MDTKLKRLLPCLLLSACSLLNPPTTQDVETVPPTQATALATATPESSSTPDRLILWLSPTLSPNSDSEAGALLRQRLDAFQQAHADIELDIRIKDQEGKGGLLESLSAASVAAPDVLPDVISLDPLSLYTAALKELLVPLDGLLPAPDAPAWYDFAVASARVDGVFYALPFASDSEVLAYRTLQFSNAPRTWADILAGSSPFLFPAGDPNAFFTLAQYLALDGPLSDDIGKPTLDPAPLADILTFYGSAHASGILPASTRQYMTSTETWNALLAERATSAVAPLSAYLKESDFQTFSAAPLPTRNVSGIGFAHTWSWAVVTKEPARQESAVELLDWLMQPEFLGPWTSAMGMLPSTALALAEWPEGQRTALVSDLVTLVRPAPAPDVIIAFGPPLQQAVYDVVGGGTTPSAAALTASQAIKGEETD